jgi:hypothetical protein
MQDDTSLKAKVEGWLLEQGYPLEMRVAQALKKRGWVVLHSRRYKDPILEKEREIDLFAINDDPSKRSDISGDLVIECKWTPSKPWVLFSGTAPATNAIGQLAAMPMTSGAMERIPFQDVPNVPIFDGTDEGYALVQTFSKEEAINAGYAAVQTVINAADFFANQMSESRFNIVFVPVVVIEGGLFRGSLTEKGEIVIDPIEFGVLSHLRATYGPRFVHIVREASLVDFIGRAERTFTLLRSVAAKTPPLKKRVSMVSRTLHPKR